MRKFASILIAAVMTAACLAAFTGSTASAGPYTGTVRTDTSARAENSPRAFKPVKVSVKVTTNGNGRPRGRLFFVFRKGGKIRDTDTRWYSQNGPARKYYQLSGKPKGRYKVKVTFNARPHNSVYWDSSDEFKVRVRPRR